MITQEESVELCSRAFGINNLTNKKERLLRFLEEAGELVQCGGMTREKAHEVIDYVFDRPVEVEMWKEIGGVMLTLYGIGYSHGHDVMGATYREYKRLEGRLETARAKHDAKPASIRAE